MILQNYPTIYNFIRHTKWEKNTWAIVYLTEFSTPNPSLGINNNSVRNIYKSSYHKWPIDTEITC